MAFYLQLDEQSVALGFVGIGDRCIAKKNSRRKSATADTKQTKALSTSPEKLPVSHTQEEDEVKVEGEAIQPEEEVKLDHHDDEMKLDQADVAAKDDDDDLASTERGLVMLEAPEEESKAEEEKEEAPEPTTADDDVLEGVGAVSLAAAETGETPKLPLSKKKKTKKAKAKRVVDNRVRGTWTR